MVINSCVGRVDTEVKLWRQVINTQVNDGWKRVKSECMVRKGGLDR